LKVEVVTVGSELLMGGISNTNLAEICMRLGEIGLEVAFATTVGDVEDRIAAVFANALDRSDVIVLTGGLGPTHDDVTREALAAATGGPLELHEELQAEIERFFASRGRKMSELNLKQAYLPRGAQAIPNPIGTAPGIRLEHSGKLIFALPGVPAEMRSMLEVGVLPVLAERAEGTVFVTRSLRAIGIGESDLAAKITEIIASCRNAGGPLITILASAGEVIVQIRGGGADREAAMKQIEPVESEIRKALGETIYGTDDATLENVVGALLKQRGHTVGVAESFTGGALTSRLVAVVGASAYLKAGFVTYATEAKVAELGVSIDILERHGAVSEETAKAMAERVRERTSSSLGLSTTGEAGPLPEEEPVGTMYIGLAWEGGSMATKFKAAGSRQDIRAFGTNAAMNLLRLWLLEERRS
jgi:competence/damage-inducible protein CinA-like protein